MSFKNRILRDLKNLPGTKTNRKLIAIFVDDYGSVRVKDKEAYCNLLKVGISVNQTRYGYDTLCTAEDLQRLFEVLISVKDKNGHHAVFTPFANIANPDFEKIRNSGYQQYFREPFTDTLKRLDARYDGVYELWKQGIAEGIFVPEYHGTEHINVRKFMKALQDGQKSTMWAFDNGSVCCPILPGEQPILHETATFDIIHASENESLKEDITVGLNMFEELLGYRSTEFTPGASIYSPSLQPALRDNGIKTIHVERYQAYPLGDGRFEKRFLYTGKNTSSGQHFLVRNGAFEVFWDNGTLHENVVEDTLLNISAAFRTHSPVLLSTHRVNFTSGIEEKHRDVSLQALKELLQEIVKRWPDVEFVSGREMSKILFNN